MRSGIETTLDLAHQAAVRLELQAPKHQVFLAINPATCRATTLPPEIDQLLREDAQQRNRRIWSGIESDCH